MTALPKAPKIYGPRDVPRLREHLLAAWSSGALRYPQTEQALVDGHLVELTVLATGEWERPILAEASMWWVAASMCEVLAAAEVQLPADTVLDPELIPAPRGLVVFESPMLGVDAQTGDRTMRVDAVLWGPVRVILGGGPRPALGIASYRRLRFEDGLGPDELHAAYAVGALEQALAGLGDRTGEATALFGDLWLPQGRSDWVLGEPVSHRHGDLISDAAQASMVEDRQRVGALWLLSAQTDIAAVTDDHGTRQEQRRAARSGQPRPTVRIVHIPAGRAAGRAAEADGEGRHLKVRSLVGASEGGFWRRRPFHPSCPDCKADRRGCGGHRPKWVHAFWRGPKDAPISNVDKVRVWR